MTGARHVRTDTVSLPAHVRLLLAIRAQHHWSQQQLAVAIGVRRNTVSRWECGETEPHEAWMKIIRPLLLVSSAA